MVIANYFGQVNNSYMQQPVTNYGTGLQNLSSAQAYGGLNNSIMGNGNTIINGLYQQPIFGAMQPASTGIQNPSGLGYNGLNNAIIGNGNTIINGIPSQQPSFGAMQPASTGVQNLGYNGLNNTIVGNGNTIINGVPYQQPAMQPQLAQALPAQFMPQIQMPQMDTGLSLMPIMNLLSQLFNAFNTQSTTQTTTDVEPQTTTTTQTTDIDTNGKGVWGDPHFEVKGKDGKMIKFDHKGVNGHTYNVFKGDNINIDAKYAPTADPKEPQVMSKANIDTVAGQIQFDKKGKAVLDGQSIAKGTTTLQDGTTIDFNGKKLIIKSPEGDSSINLVANGNCINIDPEGNFSDIGGILGQAILNNKKLTNAESNQFDVTQERGIA